MKFPAPLLKGKLVERYKRFLADVTLEDGAMVTAHCANPGSMMGLKDTGMTVWLSPSNNPKRKLKYSWEMAESAISGAPALVGVHTNITNKLAEEAIQDQKISELMGYEALTCEVKYGQNSRIDLLLTHPDKADCYVEVKSVTLMRKAGRAEFPDSKTIRGTKHLGELSAMVSQGHRAVMLYIIQRPDAQAFSLCQDIDPDYVRAFHTASKAGVEMLCYDCTLCPQGIVVNGTIPFETSLY